MSTGGAAHSVGWSESLLAVLGGGVGGIVASNNVSYGLIFTGII